MRANEPTIYQAVIEKAILNALKYFKMSEC